MPKGLRKATTGARTQRTVSVETDVQDVVDVEDEREVATSSFVDITQADPSVARHVLEACEWNIEQAIACFLEGGGVPGQGVDQGLTGTLGVASTRAMTVRSATWLSLMTMKKNSYGLLPVTGREGRPGASITVRSQQQMTMLTM
jgi:hypothetical protein